MSLCIVEGLTELGAHLYDMTAGDWPEPSASRTPVKVFLVCPRARSGGPENIHQLCEYLNVTGVDASIFYVPNPEEDFSNVYPEFRNVRVAARIEDREDSVVVVPEVYRFSDIKRSLDRATLAIWWLSYVNAWVANVLSENIQADAIHLFHSYYEYAMVRPHLSPGVQWGFLTDCIDDEFLSLDPASFVSVKQDIVCFNGIKDKITEKICTAANIPCIAIIDMSRPEVMETLRKCKVYVDNGFHPGKDHLPREAAMHGCVVITNKSGSAAYFEDVPIEEKVTFEEELYELIPTAMSNYGAYFDKQESYRKVICDEKMHFQRNADKFIRRLSGSGSI